MFHEFGHALHGMLSNVSYPLLSGTAGAARLRRVPLAVQRDVGARAGGGGALRAATTRPARRCRRSCSPRCWRRRNSTRAMRPPSTSPRRCSTRPGTRSRTAQAPRAAGVCGLRAGGAASERARLRAGAAALPLRLLLAHLRGRLLGRLLRLPVERGAGARHRAVVPRARRPDARQRRRPARQGAVARPQRGPAGAVPQLLRRAPEIGPLLEYRGLAGGG